MKRVVIIGGGFAGSYAARKLENEFDVTLIDSKNYFEFTPGILRTIVEPSHAEKIQVLHRDYLKRAKIIIGEVKEAAERFVKVNGRKVEFDYLVISSGSRYESLIKEQNIVLATRASHLRNYYEKFRRAKRVLLIGGGIVGVELAAEIATHCKDKEITLVHSQGELMPRNCEKTRIYAEEFLRKRGVKLIFNDRVEKVTKKKCFTKNCLKLEADLVFICTGIKPNYEFMKKNFSNMIDREGYLKVNRKLQLEGHKNIFVCGDVSSVKEEKLAQNAQKQGEVVVCNIEYLEKGEELRDYAPGKRIMVISLGRFNGILQYGEFIFTGIFPGILKTLIEKRQMMRRGRIL